MNIAVPVAPGGNPASRTGHETYSTLAWRFTTGFKGVDTEFVKDVRRSRSVEAESVRVADARVLRVSICPRTRHAPRARFDVDERNAPVNE